MRTIRKVNDISKARKKAKKGGWGLKKVEGSVYQTVRLKKPKKTAKRKTTKRNTTQKKSAKSKKTKLSPTRKFDGEVYGRATNPTTKTKAKQTAKSVRKKGLNARVVQTSQGSVVYATNTGKVRIPPGAKKNKKDRDAYRRTFGGEVYYGQFVKTKTEARKLQMRAKSAGINARLAKVSGGYSVFTPDE